MESTSLRRDWKDVLEHLSEKKPPLRLNILDTIAFDRLTVPRPLFWLYTSREGFLQCRNVRNMSIDEVVQTAVASVSNPLSTRIPRYLLTIEDSTEALAVAVCENARFVLAAKALLRVPPMLDGLVLLKSPGRKFDRRVFIHEVRVQGASYMDDIRAANISDLSLEEPVSEDEIRGKVKAASVRFLESLLLATHLGLQQIRLLYRYEIIKREAWLLGLDDCFLVRLQREDRLHRASMSVMSISVDPLVQPTHNSPQLPRTASRFFKVRKGSKEPYGQTNSRKFRWGSASHIVGIAESGKVSQSNKESPQRVAIHCSSRMLKTNEAAFKGVAFCSKEQLPKKVSKLNKSYSGKLLAKTSSAWEDAYAPLHDGAECWGQFCHVQVPPGDYPTSARFLVPQELIEAAKSADTSSRLESPPRANRRRHKKALSEGVMMQFAVNKLVAKTESVMLPVCSRCFAVYAQVKANKAKC